MQWTILNSGFVKQNQRINYYNWLIINLLKTKFNLFVNSNEYYYQYKKPPCKA